MIWSSARTSSACFIQSSRRSLTSSAIKPSPKLSCARRISITPLPPGLARSGVGTQQIVIKLTYRLDRLLQFLVVVQPATNLGDPLAAHTDLPRASARISHGQHRDRVTFAARAFWAA